MGYPVEVSAKLLPRLLSWMPPIGSAAELDVLGLPASAIGTLFDVGCGNGDFIARMASLGWKASGIDPDPIAASQARGRGLEVSTGGISDTPCVGRYDVITMNHVIEHAADPIALLQECLKRLHPLTGRLVITTPNLESLGHRWFRKYWRGLEVPRHLVLFSPAALRQCVDRAGLRVHSLSTRTRLARMIYCPSICAKRGGREIGDQNDFPVSTKMAAYLFQAAEDLSLYFRPGWGEEIFCVCIAPELSQETSP
jgi:SAM-dependent methyltransferase